MEPLVNGLAVGTLYALVASSLLLIFGILEIPDFALGGRLMLGGYVAWIVAGALGRPYWLGVAASVIAAALLGAVSEVGVYRHLRRGPALGGFVGALVLLTITEVVAQLVWGATYRKVPSPYESTVFDIAGAHITAQRALAGVAALALIGLLHLYLRGTRSGAAMRATIEDRAGARLVGISPNRMALLAVTIGSGLAGAAGALLAPIYLVYPTAGDNILIKALIVVVLAGMRSSLGAIFGALLLGVIESYGSVFVSAGFTDAYAFVVLIVALVIRPSGLFSREVLAR
jgi:branched-chain amino acid transport system permease protein